MLDFFPSFAIIIPVLDTQRISVTVAHRTLTPFAGVRIPHPLPKIDRFQPVDFLSIAKAMAYHQHGVAVLYLISPSGLHIITRSVYQNAFAMMIYNSYGIDDMQDFVLMIYTASP